jgi:large subunit ribosomal protein L6
MSRIGKQIIPLPAGVVITPAEAEYTVTGTKGTLVVPRFAGVDIQIADSTAQVVVVGDPLDAQVRSFYGLLRVLLANAVTGVSTGWSRDLELHGVGMRAALAGTSLNLSLGFSHPVMVDAPQGITFLVTKNVITVSGIDKQLVGETAAKIRQHRKPEPYKGKGIRYSGEYIRRKAGKTGKAAK